MEITNYIKEDLSARLRSGQELPVALTIDALSEHYQVSFTPVRTAIAELINEGLVIKGPNRRLIAAQVPKGLGQPIPQPEFPPDKFSLVLNDLVQLSLRGQAIILREEVTAEKYGISRSAIRSILHRLAGEGVLDHLPRKGWRLRPFLQADLQAFIEVREVLEIKALELAQLKLDPIVLQQMLAANHLPTSEDLEPRIDESLHEYLVAQSRNSYIRDFFDRHFRYYRMLFEWEDHDPDVALETIRQHQEILSALLENNLSAAKKALSHHILDNHPILGNFSGNLK